MTDQEIIEEMLRRAGLDIEISGSSVAKITEIEVLRSTLSLPHGYVRFEFELDGALITVYGLSDGSKVGE